MSNGKPLRKKTIPECGKPTVAKLGPDIKAKIGQHLRSMYAEVVNQGVPDRFAEILRHLDDPPGKPTENEADKGPPE
jgi:Anti-sigma factor NepR